MEKDSNIGKIVRIRSDHGKEFENSVYDDFCKSNGITHEFSAPKTPEQNGVVERKNKILQEMARVLLNSKKLSKRLWAEAISTACYIINRVFLRPNTSKTPYEIWKGKRPNVSHFHVFGCVCYVLRDREHVGKFDAKSDVGVFLGYSNNSRAYRVYNMRTQTVMESANVVFDDTKDFSEFSTEKEIEEFIDKTLMSTPTPVVVADRLSDSSEPKPDIATSDSDDTTDDQVHSSSHEIITDNIQREPSTRVKKNHPADLILGNLDESMVTRRRYVNLVQYMCFTSSIEPKNINEALLDESWTNAMQEELEQFSRNDVWTLVPRPSHVNVIGTKWIFKNKSDEFGTIVRNKARLVAQGYTQIEGVDFDETFAPVARLESIRLLLAISCIMKIKLHQMDVKSAFLNGFLNEEAYVEQPKGFEDPHFPNHVFKLKKALYGLKQAPRAWYERLTQFLVSHGYQRGGSDKTLFIKRVNQDIIVAQIYVDDIVFGSSSNSEVQVFVQQMQEEFEMSMVGELTFFLGLQVKQASEGTFISQSKYAKNLVKKFGLESAKPTRTPMGTTVKLTKDEGGVKVDPTLYRSMIGSLLYLTASRPDISYSVGVCARYQGNPMESHVTAVKRIIRYVNSTLEYGIWYSKDTKANLVGFSDADWAGNADDRKSTSGGCFYVGNNLVSWLSKKQNSISLSTAEAEYIAAGSCCTQLLWMKQMMSDYGFEMERLTIYCDNTSAINISKNPVQHSRTKHIDIRHHFIRELVEQNALTLEYVETANQLADIFTKSLDSIRFDSLRKSLGVCSI